MESMKTFKDLKFLPVNGGGWLPTRGMIAEMNFENNYGVVVKLGNDYYSNGIDTYEINVLKGGAIWHDTPFSEDELDYRTANDVSVIMKKVQEFESRKLTEWENNRIARIDSSKPIRFNYKIVDCEHMGDIEYAERECSQFCATLGGKVVGNYWDGEDCGEAYIVCEFPSDKGKEIILSNFFECDFYQP